MRGMYPAPVTELGKFDLPLHLLLVLIGVIITPLTHGAAEGDQTVCALHFSHADDDTTISAGAQARKSQKF